MRVDDKFDDPDRWLMISENLEEEGRATDNFENEEVGRGE